MLAMMNRNYNRQKKKNVDCQFLLLFLYSFLSYVSTEYQLAGQNKQINVLPILMMCTYAYIHINMCTPIHTEHGTNIYILKRKHVQTHRHMHSQTNTYILTHTYPHSQTHIRRQTHINTPNNRYVP